MKEIKIVIHKSEWYPCFSIDSDIDDPSNKSLPIIEIPEDKFLWVQKALKEGAEVNVYLAKLYKTPTFMHNGSERLKKPPKGE